MNSVTVGTAVVDLLVQSATDLLLRHGDGQNHTVAAAICAADGSLYTGLNLYHFTGGPCAEIVALARLISEGGGAPVALAAVGDRGRGVLAPCGRCRQILADYCPDVHVVLTIAGRPVPRPLKALLPHAYVWAEPPSDSQERELRGNT